MTELTVLLPFALPPAELAADLVRAARAPHLAALLARSASCRRSNIDGGGRSLPHERVLVQLAGLNDAGLPGLPGLSRLPFAAAVMRGFGLDPAVADADAHWWIVQPAHIEIARTHLLMSDARRLGLAESHARALFDSARPYFEELGHTLVYGDAGTWFMRADAWAGLDTASPDATGGMNLTDAMPVGAAALAYRKLQNEVQMLWHSHPANGEREARGLPVINGFWPWAGASAGSAGSVASRALASANAPPWMAALGSVVHGSVADWLQAPERPTTLVEASLIGPALGTDWADWLQQLARIDREVLAPTLAAVKGGLKLQLVLSHRSALLEVGVSALSQRRFWRRHSLDRLLG
ncbi:hypothetical protein [Massilia sp. PWRC2]|uniref:hypothetical protein n=1 Tax=Massilia sp. PWRC2 TaxID=2804626 RepID=UPI003CF7BB65